MPLPTFVIAGAQKSGTSTLSTLVRLHSGAHVHAKKEVHFFDWYFKRGLDWYSDEFSPAPSQRVIGESTPTYMYLDEARHRMMKSLPEAKIVVIMREPVSRAYSHYWHSFRLGYEPAGTFEEAVALELKRLATGQRKHQIRHSYLDRGRYVEQLRDLATVYGPDQLHTLTLDDLSQDRLKAFTGVCTFLGLSTEGAPVAIERWEGSREAQDNRPDKRENAYSYPPISRDTRARLVEEFRPYNDALAQWAGRDLSAWSVV